MQVLRRIYLKKSFSYRVDVTTRASDFRGCHNMIDKRRFHASEGTLSHQPGYHIWQQLFVTQVTHFQKMINFETIRFYFGFD